MTTPDEYEAWSEPEQERFASHYRDVGLRFLARGDESTIRRARTAYGVGISAHRPDELKTVDAFLTESLLSALKRRGTYESVAIALGCYVGEVFVRNLPSRWHIPNLAQAIVMYFSRSRFSGERYAYVVLANQKVLVFHAARQAIDKTGAVFSLYNFYQNCARAVQVLPEGLSPTR